MTACRSRFLLAASFPKTDAWSRILASDGSAYRTPATLPFPSFAPDTPLLFGFSGGADSRLLLAVLYEECRQNGAKLTLCHVHHGIRGSEADRDAAFCQTVAAQYGLPLRTVHLDVPTEAQKTGESLEACARRLRYATFAAIMREEGIPLLVTAHHADDNLETALFRLARGTGLHGLSGMAPARPFPEAAAQTPAYLVRPFLSVSKCDILAALREGGMTYVEDSTNADTTFSRNRLRAEAIPALRAVFPHPEQQFARASRLLREDDDCLCTLAQDAWNRLRTDPLAEADALPLSGLRALHPAIASRVLRIWLDEAAVSPEETHLRALSALVENGYGELNNLPGGFTVYANGIRLCRGKAAPACAPFSPLSLQNVPHGAPNPDAHTLFSVYSEENISPCENVYKPFTRDTLSFATIDAYVQTHTDSTLLFRPRRSGDTLRLHGKTHAVRKLQNEVHLPGELRDALPLLCDGDTVLWVPFCAVSDDLPPTADCSAPLLTVIRTTL